MESLTDKILSILSKEKTCSIATYSDGVLDNTIVNFYSEDFKIYFGTFADTRKAKNIVKNNVVAMTIGPIQYHGKASILEDSTDQYNLYRRKYVEKFPNLDFYFDLEGNVFFEARPLVIWLYDSSKGLMYRDKLVFDSNYYKAGDFYSPPSMFKRKKVVTQ